MDHQCADCPNGWPSASGYQILTKEAALAAKSCSVAAIVAANTGSENLNQTMTVTTIISIVLDDGPNLDIKCIPHFHTPHPFWDCQVDGPGSPLPISVQALIDCGSHTVFIDLALVDTLALHCQTLHIPIEISLAIGDGEKVLVMREWVKFSVLSCCYSWKWHTLCAIVAEKFVCPILLGHPFLQINQIVIDHSIPLCIAKNLDLNY